jgi:hypothetical protein
MKNNKVNNTPIKVEHVITKDTHPFFHDYNDDQYIKSYAKTKIIVVEEKKRKYSLTNDLQKEIIVYHIDGGLIQEKEEGDIKCDYGIYTEDKLLILVELKGSDYEQAISQILNTTKKLEITKDSKKIEKLLARVVLSKGTNVPYLRSSALTELKNLLKQFKGNILAKSKELEENLSKI